MTITDKQVEAACRAYFRALTGEGNFDDVARRSKITMREHIRPALEAHDAAGWEPIATAPMDGTEVLVATSAGVTIAAYGKASHVPLYGFVPIGQDPEDRDLCSPTHWRPIPAPPKGE